jgi:hypothetical protein
MLTVFAVNPPTATGAPGKHLDLVYGFGIAHTYFDSVFNPLMCGVCSRM